MKKIWMALCAATLAFTLYGTIESIVTHSFDEDAVLAVIFLLLLAGLFAYLAWVWRIKSPFARLIDQVGNIAGDMQERHMANKELSAPLKRRKVRMHIIGALLFLAGCYVIYIGFNSTFLIIIAAFLWIIGITVWCSASPSEYNALTDMASMIGFNTPTTIEQVYEDFKMIDTPLGSAWLGKFSTFAYKCMIFGPDADGNYIYFWVNKKGELGYIGYSFVTGFIKKRYTEPIFPVQPDSGVNLGSHICYHSDIFLFTSWLEETLQTYAKTGQVREFNKTQSSDVYTFDEDFKLLGQHFTLRDTEQNVIYEIDGTAPLINLRIFDAGHNEVFKMTKEIGHLLPIYRFYYKGEEYGILEKQFALVRDTFTMEIREGKLKLEEYAGTIGHNFKVTLNNKVIGAIMDNMDITIANVVFDNSFIIVYEQQYLPLLTAMAVMVARELARDQEGGMTNRDFDIDLDK